MGIWVIELNYQVTVVFTMESFWLLNRCGPVVG